MQLKQAAAPEFILAPGFSPENPGKPLLPKPASVPGFRGSLSAAGR
jgi:hypothetical protein